MRFLEAQNSDFCATWDSLGPYIEVGLLSASVVDLAYGALRRKAGDLIENGNLPDQQRLQMEEMFPGALPMNIQDVLSAGMHIDNLEIAPAGYQLFERGGRKYIRRLDSSNPETPRVMVNDEGSILPYTAPQRLSVSSRFKRNLEDIFGPLPEGHQRHHLVPDNVVRNSPLHQEAMKRGLFNVDRGTNGGI